jgi:predicted DNA-binding protein
VKRAVVRLPSEVVERLDLLVRKLRARHPARNVSRAAVVRALIASALAVAEADAARRAEEARARVEEPPPPS